MGRQAMRTVVREEALVGWYLRVLEPGRVPTAGIITVEAHHPAAITVGAVQRALNDHGTAYPDLAALEPLAPGLRRALARPGRDLSGGVPERD
jgi:MOSC domain-containing protein YiiM